MLFYDTVWVKFLLDVPQAARATAGAIQVRIYIVLRERSDKNDQQIALKKNRKKLLS